MRLFRLFPLLLCLAIGPSISYMILFTLLVTRCYLRYEFVVVETNKLHLSVSVSVLFLMFFSLEGRAVNISGFL